MIECGKCGTANHFDGAIFCKSCGAELSSRVLVKIADEPTRSRDKTQPIATQSDTRAEQAGDDFIVTDLPIDDIESKKSGFEKPTLGGFDQLLKQYESDRETNLPAEDAIEPVQLSSELGIESPTDYLMRKQQEIPEDDAIIAMPTIESAPASELPVEPTKPIAATSSVTRPGNEAMRSDEHVVSDDDRDRLLNSLQKTLAEEKSAADSQSQHHLANQQAESVPAENEEANSVARSGRRHNQSCFTDEPVSSSLLKGA
jgi:hypothetical protein